MSAVTVVAVIPSYRPPAELAASVRATGGQVARVVVVDDGSGGSATGVLEAVAEAGGEVHRLAANSGIAAALNAGIRVALADPATTHVLTLDQDSTLSPGYVDLALAEFADDRVGVVVPAVVADVPVPGRGSGPRRGLPLEPIQSGMLTDRRTLELVGDFREEFVIDCVDADFYQRVLRAGVLPATCRECSLGHTYGAPGPALGGRRIASYSPTRRYYMTRNRLTVLREYRDDREWARRMLLAESRALLVSLLLGSARGRQLHAVAAGVTASIRRRGGRIPDGLARRLEPRGPA